MRRRLSQSLIFLAVALPAERAVAQGLHELERRVDAAVALRDDAKAELVAYRNRPSPVRVFPETVAVLDGAVRIVTDPEFVGIARDAAARVTSRLREPAGKSAAVLNGTVFALWTDSIRRSQHGVIVSPRVNEHEVDSHYVLAMASSLAEWLQQDLQARIGMRRKPEFARWLAGSLPITVATNADWRMLRMELVSSPYAVERRCYMGDLRACKATLGLLAEPDPALAWLDSAGRRSIVAGNRQMRLDQHMVEACLAGRDAECVNLLRSGGAFDSWLNPPGSGQARTLLVQEAFLLGGPGWLDRLARAPDDASLALGASASMSVDSLVAHWQRHAHDGGIESESATPVVALGAAAWVLVMGMLSTRSSRWR